MDLVNLIYAIKEQSNEEIRNSELLKFVGFCLQNADRSYAQNYQDVWALWQAQKLNIKDLFFVEFGATDGITSSNTYLLEKEFGWKGILAEPNPFWHNDLLKNRTCSISKDCVFDRTGDVVDFMMVEAADLSTIKGFGKDEFTEQRKKSELTKVNTISLVDLLDSYKAPAEIDYLSIDTEGSEYGILNAFFQNNKKYYIRNITVEHNFSMREILYELLTANGYKRVFAELSRWDDFYTRS